MTIYKTIKELGRPDGAELLDLFSIQQNVQPHQVGLDVPGIFVVEAGVA